MYISVMKYADISIAVVGSGLAGSTFIAAIAAYVREVILLERCIPEAMTQLHDQRPISLSYSTYVMLQNLGLWDQLSVQAGLIEQVHVSEQGRLGSLQLTAADAKLDALGYVIPFGRLQEIIYRQALSHANVRHIIMTDVIAINEADSVEITLMTTEGEQIIYADYLVAADGMHSPCRELLNISIKKTDHHDNALTAILTLQQPHDGIAYERFTKQAVFALLPMWDRYQYRLVCTLDSEQSSLISDDNLLRMATECFASRIGPILSLVQAGCYPLKTIIAKQQTTQRCVLLGDSAHRIYPLSAQGYNLTVRDCAVLVDCLTHSCSLDDYARARKTDQQFIVNFTQGLEWLFGLQFPLLNHLRSTALFKIDMLLPLKRKLIQQLLGRQGHLAELLCET